MCRTLVHELNREPLKTTKELLDIATRQVSGVEEVGAAFILATTKSVRKGTKSGKTEEKWCPQCVAVVASNDDGD
jgi:hypothetical protein